MQTETELQTSRTTARVEKQSTSAPPKIGRIPALDFTKGALVLVMVLYHWINYFIGPQWKYYFYLRFLTPSFIFITGFMISHVYLSKYSPSDSRLWKRLITRGLKLMMVFLALNVVRNLVVPFLGATVAPQDLPTLHSLFAIFVSGDLPVTGAKLVSFSILVPISYLLILAGALMLPYRLFRYAFHVACAVLFLSIFLLRLVGARNFNLEFVAIGMLGVLVGFTPLHAIDKMGEHPYWLLFLYLGYLAGITIWNVPFLLLVVAVFLNLSALYLLGAGGSEAGAIRRRVLLLGKYSLFGYIVQVGILQILSAGFHRVNFGSAALSVSFLLAFALTVGSVEALDRIRAKSAGANRIYIAIFA